MRYLLGTVLCLSLWSTSPALSQETAGSNNGAKVKGKWINELGLDDAQKTKLRTLWKEKRTKVADLRKELKAMREELKTILASDASADKARDVHKRLQAIQEEVGNIDLESMLAIRDLLSTQQRAKFVELMNKRGKFGEPI